MRYLSKLTCCCLLLLLITAISAQTQLSEFLYYWDNGSWDTAESLSLSSSDLAELTTAVPIASLSDGFHFLHYRAKNSGGKWSLPETRAFWVKAYQPIAEIVASEYFVDTDPGLGNATPIDLYAGELPEFFTLLDCASMSPGIHTLQVRVRNSLGEWSLPNIRYFNRSTDQQFSWVDKLEYFIDQDPGIGNGHIVHVIPGTDIEEVFNIVMDEVGPGFHFLGMRASSNLGKTSLPNWRMLFRTSSPVLDNIESINWYFTGSGVNESDPYSLQVPSPAPMAYITHALPLTHLQQGSTYKLHVYAITDKGKKSHEMIVPFTVNWTPQNLQESTSDTHFVLAWDPIIGASSYKVYSGIDPDQELQYAGSTRNTSWSDLLSHHKFFRVKAVRD